MANFIAYLRVSTTQQGQSGLGIEAQRRAVTEYLARTGGTLVAEYVEVESGRHSGRSDRPKLHAAMADCRTYGATLLVAKLDRLARDPVFLLSLQDSGIDFLACDMPAANRLTVGILAVVAEAEADMISARTKAALAAAKARGVQIGAAGCKNLRPDAGARGRATARGNVKARAQQRADDRAAHVERLRAAGVTSPAALARELTAARVPTPAGAAEWSCGQVQRLLARLAS
jgi:DNA invertase Pin-like site-specific DNA recombinase